MAKKIGKILLFTAAVSTAVAAVHYYLQKKGAEHTESEDEDYDDFSEDSSNCVPLTPDGTSETAETAETAEAADSQPAPKEDGFTPLKDSVENVAEKAAENVEEFFDEEDSSDEEPAITDN